MSEPVNRWWIFSWGEPLCNVTGGPRYWGLYWRGFQVGYWERPASYARRIAAKGSADV